MRYPLPFTLSLATYAGYMTAQTVLAFTLPLLAFELSGSGLDLGVIKGAAFLPNIVFAVFIGVLNDRIAKRVSFPLYAGIMALAVLALWLALRTGQIGLPGLVVFMVTFNAAGYAMGNAQNGLIRLTVPEDRLSDATSLASGLNATIATAGPALGGLMLGALGHEGLIGVLALALLATSVLSLAVRPAEVLPPPPRSARGWPRAGGSLPATASSGT